jgi:hypothetical protein
VQLSGRQLSSRSPQPDKVVLLVASAVLDMWIRTGQVLLRQAAGRRALARRHQRHPKALCSLILLRAQDLRMC